MSHPLVSTIIPAYRAARTIGRAVDSLLAQTRPPEEIVIVDDGSPDDLAAAVRPYGDRVRLLRKANGGAASARNHGIEQSQGDLIAFLDADDYWEPTKLERQLAVLNRHPEVGLAAANYYCEPPGQPRFMPLALDPAFYERAVRASGERAFALATRIWTSTVLVRRAVLAERRFDQGLGTAEDVDLWVRIAVACPVYLLAAPLATGVLEAGSLSRSDIAGDCRNMLRVIHRNAALLGPRGVRKWEAKVYRDWAADYLGNGRPHLAVPYAWRRLWRQPFSAQGWWILCKSATSACHFVFCRRQPASRGA
jgi:glycosyltransferase involved in cell wall biosynthesis